MARCKTCGKDFAFGDPGFQCATYVFDSRELLHALDQLTDNNRQREYYLTDCPGILKGEGKDVRALPVLKACEALSINTVEELQIVEAEMRKLSR